MLEEIPLDLSYNYGFISDKNGGLRYGRHLIEFKA